MKWGVVVAAGGLVKDPLASALGTPRKALAVIQGQTCLERTLEAVKGTGVPDCVTVSGLDVEPQVSFGRLVLEGEGQIENARLALQALGEVEGVLFLPADTPLLSPQMLTAFMQRVDVRIDAGSARWLAAGLTTLDEFQAILPRITSQAINLKEGAFLSGALYAASPAAFYNALSVLEKMSNSRKNQLAMLVKLGPWTIVRYLLHRVSVSDAEQRLGRVFDGQAIIVTGCDPRMAADIDDVADYDELRIFANLEGGGA